MKRTHIMYFDIKTNALAWIEMIKPLPIIFEIENGLAERKFTDKDYKGIITECPKKE